MKWVNIKSKVKDKLNILYYLPELFNKKRKVYVYYAIPHWTKKYNWGDDINPVLVDLLSSKQAIPYQFCWFKHRHYLCIGSIIQWYCDRNAIIWGSGLLYPVRHLNHPRKVLAVRGPLTRQCLLENGINCPEVYGDPALIFPKFYHPRIAKKYKLGIICHESEISEISEIYIPQMRTKECLLIDIKHYHSWHSFIDQILSCEIILSSSLHGIIISDAYGVPNLWCKFTNYEAPYEGFKFKDYFLSVGKSVDTPFSLQNKKISEIEAIVFNQWKKPEIDLNPLLDACPFSK